MSITTATHPTRRVLTGIAVAAVAATCLVCSGATVSASGAHRADVSSATKEWKSSSAHDAKNVVSATKEYRSLSLTKPATKEW
jgi:hypothetical protein